MDFIISMFLVMAGWFAGYGPVVIGWLFNLVYVITAIVVVFTMLRYLDKRLGVKFREDVLRKLEQEPMALAVYRAAWIIGACLLAGLMLGASGGG